MHRACILVLSLLIAATGAAQETTLTIHYHRFDDNYSGWGLHLWGAVEWADGGVFWVDSQQYNWQNPLLPDGQDSYGALWTIPIIYPDDELGFIVHRGDIKDPEGDRIWSDYDTHPEIWLLSGFSQIFTEEPNPNIRLMAATSNGSTTITLQLATTASNLEAFTVTKDGTDEPVASRGAQDDRVFLTMENPIDITVLYEVHDSVGENSVAVRHEFDEEQYVYDGGDLGFTYSLGQTIFKIWSPTCQQAKVLVFDSPFPVPGETWDEHVLTRPGVNGVLEVTVAGDLKGKYYLYELTQAGQTYTTPDLYSRALSSNSQRSMIFDAADSDPVGWEQDSYPTFDTLESIVYELHIRDVTCYETWTGTEANRCKYLGLVEPGTTWEGQPTGFDHILDLGVNTVQILPMYDFTSVDETNPDSRNWGYDPFSYNTPEGSYASDPDDLSRLRELKQMVMAFHAQGIKVVMDVVYNHTHNTGLASLYDAFVPKYYYRLNTDGSYANGSGVGNEVATERPMARRFILQSCKYWVEEFHIDGFRFDLMGLIDTELMAEITQEVKAINPHAIIYGEPWGGFGAHILTGKGDQRGLGFGVFNDNIRNAIRGSTDGTDPGYAMNDANDRSGVVRGIDGSINDFTDGPTETINYISAHDNYTWWDKLVRWNTLYTPPANYPDSELIRMNKFGISMVMTAQGIPFMHAGSEFLRTKRTGDPGQDEETVRNSYAADDEVNKLDWQRKADNLDVYHYYQGLIALRRGRAEFRLPTKTDIEAYLHFVDDAPQNTIIYSLDDVTPADDWGDILVAHNPTHQAVSAALPAGDWIVVVDDDEAGLSEVQTGPSYYVGTDLADSFFDIPPRTTVVMYQALAPGVRLNIFQNPNLDRFLHFAVNAVVEQAGPVTLMVNGAAVDLQSLADGSWFGSYTIEESGEMTVVLQSSSTTLTRRFIVGNLDPAGGRLISLDGRAELVIPAGVTAEIRYAAVFDRAGKPDLPVGVYEFGHGNFQLLKPALLRIIGDNPRQAIYRFDGESWERLPSTVADGYVEAKTDQLGRFKLGDRPPDQDRTRLLGNYPNPFNPETTIRFTISSTDAGQPVTLKVFDLRGKLVRSLLASELPAGDHDQRWDGRNEAGESAASGLYIYRLTTPRHTLAGRMLMVK